MVLLRVGPRERASKVNDTGILCTSQLLPHAPKEPVFHHAYKLENPAPSCNVLQNKAATHHGKSGKIKVLFPWQHKWRGVWENPCTMSGIITEISDSGQNDTLQAFSWKKNVCSPMFSLSMFSLYVNVYVQPALGISQLVLYSRDLR